MTIRWQPKTPTESRDYLHDWTPFLGEDTIQSQVTVGDGVTVSETVESDDRSVSFTVSGGSAGIATVTHTITSAGGRVETETFLLPISAVEEPISLADAKEHLRVLDDSEDAFIEGLIPAARRYVENRTGLILKQRQFTEVRIPQRGVIGLYRSPVVSIDSVEYPDSAGDAATYADARFIAGSSALFPALGESWPVPYAGEGFTVTYTAGLSAEELAADEYAGLIHAMKLLIGHWFVSRSGVTGDTVQEVPVAVHSLCDQERLQVL